MLTVNYDLLIDSVVKAANSYSCHLTAIVGSSSPFNHDIVDAGSDVDLIILLDTEAVDEVSKHWPDVVPSGWQVAATWNIVSAVAMGSPTIHLHMCLVSEYETRSRLLRRSLGKYPSLVGRDLIDYAPVEEITSCELIKDPLGIEALRRRVARALKFSMHYRTSSIAETASLIDISLYCVLHSTRNTLRWLKSYEEYSPLEHLASQWTDAKAPHPEALLGFIGEKRARRQGRRFSLAEQRHSARSCVSFLRSLQAWIEDRH